MDGASSAVVWQREGLLPVRPRLARTRRGRLRRGRVNLGSTGRARPRGENSPKSEGLAARAPSPSLPQNRRPGAFPTRTGCSQRNLSDFGEFSPPEAVFCQTTVDLPGPPACGGRPAGRGPMRRAGSSCADGGSTVIERIMDKTGPHPHGFERNRLDPDPFQGGARKGRAFPQVGSSRFWLSSFEDVD